MYMSSQASQATQENEVDMHNPIQLISSAYIITVGITRQINIYEFKGKQYAFYISSGANGVLTEGTLFPFYGTTAKSGHRFVKASQFESSTLSAWKSTLVAQDGCNALKAYGTDSILKYFKSFEELQISAAFGSKIWDTNIECVPFILSNDYIDIGSFTPREQPIPDNSGLKEVVKNNRELHDYEINKYLQSFGFHTEIDLDTKVQIDLDTKVHSFMNPTVGDAESEHYKGIHNRVERNKAADLEVQRNKARQAKFDKNRKLGGGSITRKRTKRRYSKKRSKRRNRNRKSNRKKHR